MGSRLAEMAGCMRKHAHYFDGSILDGNNATTNFTKIQIEENWTLCHAQFLGIWKRHASNIVMTSNHIADEFASHSGF